MMKLLLERGVDYLRTDREGMTPLMIAAEFGRAQNIEVLLDWDKKKIEQQNGNNEKDSDQVIFLTVLFVCLLVCLFVCLFVFV